MQKRQRLLDADVEKARSFNEQSKKIELEIEQVWSEAKQKHHQAVADYQKKITDRNAQELEKFEENLRLRLLSEEQRVIEMIADIEENIDDICVDTSVNILKKIFADSDDKFIIDRERIEKKVNTISSGYR